MVVAVAMRKADVIAAAPMEHVSKLLVNAVDEQSDMACSSDTNSTTIAHNGSRMETPKRQFATWRPLVPVNGLLSESYISPPDR